MLRNALQLFTPSLKRLRIHEYAGGMGGDSHDLPEIPIQGMSIKLGQLLKLSDLASSGGDAKQLLADGAVKVNGEPEARRGRTLGPGDIVSCEGRGEVRVV